MRFRDHVSLNSAHILGILFLICGIFHSSGLWAQVPVINPEKPELLSLSFARQNNFTWTSNLDLYYKIEKGKYRLEADLHHDNMYNTALDEYRFVQIYLRSSIWNYYRINRKLDITAWLETDQFFKTQAQNNQNQKISLYSGIKWKPNAFIEIRPVIGYTLDLRGNIMDDGFTPGLFLVSEKEWEGGYSQETRIFARYKFIQPRRQHNLSVSHFWRKEINKDTWLIAGVKGGTHELDNYLPSGGSGIVSERINPVQRIISDSVSAHFNLNYAFTDWLVWTSQNQFLWNRRDFLYQFPGSVPVSVDDRSFNGLEATLRQQLAFRRKRISGHARYEYLFIKRSYDLTNSRDKSASEFETLLEREKEKDFDRDLHQMELFADWTLRKNQHLEFKWFTSYMQFDTPSEVNFDDRDEISNVASVTWRSAWTGVFRTNASLSGNWRKFAFLFAEKSQDNYTQRSLRMDYGFEWMLLPNLSLNAGTAVYVTYNVKDFTDFNFTDRSTRNLETNGRIQWKPNPAFETSINFNRKETHQSYLNWEEFSETTLDTNVITIGEWANEYRIPLKNKQHRLIISAGYKHFDQTRRLQSSMFDLSNALQAIYLRRINLQTGPTTGIIYRNRKGSFVEANVWFQYQIRRNRFRTGDFDPFFATPQKEEDLREVSTILNPFVSIKVNFFLP